MTAKPECIWPVAAETGEGPVWDAAARAVWFVDIPGLRIHRFDTKAGTGRSWATPSATGFLAPVKGGTFIAGMKTGLHTFDPETGAFTFRMAVHPERPHNRLNDGCVDAKGRLWFGSMDDNEREPTGHLYLYRKDGPVACDGPYVVTNGPAVSPDGRVLYHVDTFGRTVYRFDVAEDGTLTNRRIFTQIDKGAWPDGLAVDAEGCVWIALWGGWSIVRYSTDGRDLQAYRFPCANITKPAFGGDDLRTLYVTTAWKGLSEAERAEQELAGGLFSLRVDTPGVPQVELAPAAIG